MDPLKLLGLTILAIFAVGIGVIGYNYARAMLDERDARQAMQDVNSAVLSVIATGSPKELEITIPDGYVMKFENRRIEVNGIIVPEEGYPLEVEGNELGQGRHFLRIFFEENRVTITEVE